MASFTHHADPRDDDFDLRCARIRQKLLDGIETALDEMAQHDLQRAAIENAVRTTCAPLFCRQATCRRAQRCRSQPCKVPAAALRI